MKRGLYERVLPTDRWSARIVSPVDIRHNIPQDYDSIAVLVGGWGKAPERYRRLMGRILAEGILALGVDTRWAYSDRRQPRKNLIQQSWRVGSNNPDFDVTSRADNRWLYRQPTTLLDVLDRLEVGERSYIGHSKGGSIATLATVARPDEVKKLIVVNGAGTGDSSNGIARLVRSNKNRAKELVHTRADLAEAMLSALGSTVYTMAHLRRTNEERRRDLQKTDTWSNIDKLEFEDVDVTVMHAKEDEMISFADCSERATSRDWVKFIPTEGGHSSIYETTVHNILIGELRL
ncbi:MAG TPA: alpha/beta hydrolase [Candidatus Saccharimonadales bacterium]|nr:alpha/beta hydrolase [Candidatus Saccharimonadales bacterium]